MELRDYLSVVRRRYRIFLAVLILVVGAHVAWVSCGRQQSQASAQIIVANGAGSSAGAPLSPVAWIKTPSSHTVKASLENRWIQERIVRLVYGDEPFTSRGFVLPPFKDEIEVYRGEFARDYGNREVFPSILADALRAVSDDQGSVFLVVRAKSHASALLISWAAAEAVVRYYDDRLDEDLEHVRHMLHDEAEALRRSLKEAEGKWGQIVAAVGFDPVVRQKHLERDIENLQSECDRLAATHRENTRRYRELVEKRPLAEGAPPSPLEVETALVDNERVAGARKRLIDLKLKLDEMLERRTRQHPEVVELEKRIGEIEQRLPDIMKEELARSALDSNDRELQDVLIQIRKTALSLEVRQEQLAALNRRAQELSSQAIVYQPVKKACDDVGERYRTVLAMENNVRFLGAAHLLGGVRIADPGRMAITLPVPGSGSGPLSLAVLLGLIAAAAAAFLREYLDVRVMNEGDVRKWLDAPLLGAIPPASRTQVGRLAAEDSEIAERFSVAATLVRAAARELDLRSFAVCSAVAQEGKTTVSVNLAAALARKGARVVLVDADMRSPRVHTLLGLNNIYGLSTVLSGWISPQQVLDGIMSEDVRFRGGVKATDALQRSAVPGLSVLTSGPSASAPAKLLESELFAKTVAELSAQAEFVIFDTPPIDRVGDGLTVASMVDGCVFVVGAGQCDRHDILWAKHLLANVQANVLGVFLNRYSFGKAKEYGYYGRGGGRTKQLVPA
ncbi:MAG TPA: polysaccharide biosynthesis tyrosine autokinase [Planctomycetota bacterium]|jgi:capsular exopolysaccharide synthesis family protein|nr:polysaccharide biosynthesis tyrosine autokinase [Planctomycetota bacterium]OQC19433.1 MAG: Tyrosine-protein kinase YwqD [Planctomycetes bacterium ADurb.Bin069]NMD36197.1 polysaccharide biosynthesis tyrosine autokinase [Planctomycetota bacterium]HNS00484.1 polysaccharide biosynthesis tyrosine autokinase [Planctomycetota bacterium]HNU27183.1 polysaccharide biosynthesis tyrosine autokinase [Planctomycetota bacterium]